MSNNLPSDLVEIPDAPNVPGLAFRHFRGEADYAVIAAVQTASNRADRVEEAIGREEVANDFAHLVNCDPDRDYIFGEVNGETVAYAKVSWRINAEGQRIYWQWGYVVPEWRRKGIGRALLNYTEARARLHAQATPIPGSSFVRGLSEDTAYGKTALFENSQYPIIRYFCFMGRKELHDLPAAPLPAGLAFRPARPADWPAIWQAKEEAFRDHWGYAPKSEAEYQHWLNDPLHRPHLWQIVWDVAKNEIAAISQNEIIDSDNEQFGFKRGWVNSLGVRRSYRGQGVARAMLVKGMQVFHEQGMTETVLGVDAENPTGALKIYESVGFRILNKDAVYQKLLT